MSNQRTLRLRTGFMVAAVLLVFIPPTHAALPLEAAAGELDPTLGGLGVVTTQDFDPNVAIAYDVALQTDGKIVAAGGDFFGSTGVVVRYHPDGTQDASYAANGIDKGPVGGGTWQGVEIDGAGRILLAGGDHFPPPSSTAWTVHRQLSNGQPDTSFSDDGFASINGMSGPPVDIALQPDGKIVVAGWHDDPNAAGGDDFVVARYLEDGMLDDSFDGDGIATIVVTDSSDRAQAMAIQPDGKIIVVGQVGVGQTFGGDIGVIRLDESGKLDATYSNDGIVQTDIESGSETPTAVTLQSDGKAVVGGVLNTGPVLEFMLARYTVDGDLDESFSQDGIQITSLSGGAMILDLALQEDGKIVAAGTSGPNVPGPEAQTTVARYETDGDLDPFFGVGGVESIPPGESSAEGVAIQEDGRIVTAGRGPPTPWWYTTHFQIARFFGDPPVPAFDGVGVVRENVWYLSGVGGTHSFAFGRPDDVRIAGDWNGNGDDNPGVVRGNVWFLNHNFDATHDVPPFGYGHATDTKLTGDWNGDGSDSPGIVRGNIWYLNDDHDPFHDVPAFGYGRATDTKVVGDWNGDGVDTPGVVRGNVWYVNNGFAPFHDVAFGFGRTTDVKLVGDWDGDGKATPGVLRGNGWYLSNQLPPTSVIFFRFGRETDLPIVGDWIASP